MCNASKHPPGCECGFGPPYKRPYSTSSVVEWAEVALDDSELAQRGLRELSWDNVSIEEFLTKYQEIKRSDLPRETMISRIRSLLGIRRKVVEDVVEDWINVPLYQFGAPNVEGAAVEYTEGESQTDSSGWLVKVFGIGTGDTASLQVSKSRTFIADAGVSKLIYIPVKLRVEHVAIYDGDQLIGRGREARVASDEEGGDVRLRRRGVRSLPAGSCSAGPEEYIDRLEVFLAQDHGSRAHVDRRAWETNVAHEVTVKLGKHIDVSALVSVKRTRRLELAFTLPAGWNYDARICPDITWWKLP